MYWITSKLCWFQSSAFGRKIHLYHNLATLIFQSWIALDYSSYLTCRECRLNAPNPQVINSNLHPPFRVRTEQGYGTISANDGDSHSPVIPRHYTKPSKHLDRCWTRNQRPETVFKTHHLSSRAHVFEFSVIREADILWPSPRVTVLLWVIHSSSTLRSWHKMGLVKWGVLIRWSREVQWLANILLPTAILRTTILPTRTNRVPWWYWTTKMDRKGGGGGCCGGHSQEPSMRAPQIIISCLEIIRHSRDLGKTMKLSPNWRLVMITERFEEKPIFRQETSVLFHAAVGSFFKTVSREWRTLFIIIRMVPS